MSYYNVTLSVLLLSVVLLYDQLRLKKYSRLTHYIIGMLLAIAVVFNPYLSVAYIMIMGIFLVFKRFRNRIWNTISILMGTTTIASLYLYYLLSRVTLEEILINLPIVLNEPEFQKTNPLAVIPIMIARIVWRYRWTILFWGIIAIYILYRRGRRQNLTFNEKKWLARINFVIFLANTYFSWGLIGCINIAWFLFAVIVVLVDKNWNEINRIIVTLFGLTGFIISLTFSFSSDTGLDAMSIGFIFLGIGAVLLIFDSNKSNKVIQAAAWIVVLQTLILRLISVYRDAPLSELDTMITSGPAKYLYTTGEHVEQYEDLKEAIEKYVRSDDIVFYSQVCFWSYLCSENEYGVPSSWRMPINSERLELYYEKNPEKIATCVFVINPTYGNFESSYIQGNEKADTPNFNTMEGFLSDYMKENDYEIIELECATIYRSK
ncbi:MAG: hypothetical protein IIW54_16325 [Lachnospiraceae bacterium]|nr:hypothetical protein [Lachnospiraceae bacterium]